MGTEAKKLNWHSIVLYGYVVMIILTAGNSINYFEKRGMIEYNKFVVAGMFTAVVWPAYISYRIFEDSE